MERSEVVKKAREFLKFQKRRWEAENPMVSKISRAIAELDQDRITPETWNLMIDIVEIIANETEDTFFVLRIGNLIDEFKKLILVAA